jgi:hypothetical protein
MMLRLFFSRPDFAGARRLSLHFGAVVADVGKGSGDTTQVSIALVLMLENVECRPEPPID